MQEHRRPAFGLVTPEGFRSLAERCWDPNYERRYAIGGVSCE